MPKEHDATPVDQYPAALRRGEGPLVDHDPPAGWISPRPPPKYQVNALVQLQIALSTAEDEKNYFTGQASREQASPLPRRYADGIYRIVDGELCLIVPGAPPLESPAATTAPASERVGDR